MHGPGAAPSGAPPARRLPLFTKLSFGLGSIAYGIKDNGFATFLLLFYNQVVGLPATMVGSAILAALVIEAFADPLVGYLSDHTRSRLGRRHPWMYGSALPVALGWVLLWNPPTGWSHGALALYLFGSALLTRLALSAFEIPASALGPELSSDYDERTRLFSYRYLFGWFGGLAMLALAYGVFLVPDAAHAVGLRNGAGYSRMALFGALAMAVAIILSSLGLQREVRFMPAVTTVRQTLAEHFALFRQTVQNRAFAVLMAASLFAYTAQGLSFALSNYLYQYVWHLHGAQYQLVAVALLAGAMGAFVLAPQAARGGDKPRIGMMLSFANAVLCVLPYVLRQLGAFPPDTSPWMVPLLLVILGVNTTAGVAAFILGSAMLSDVVEDAELRTGQRSEGVFFAGSFFIQKTTTGLGTFLASAVLAASAFPIGADAATLSPAVVSRLVIWFIVLMFTLYGIASLLTSRFPFGRAEHLERLARLGVERG
ncbi:MFS transporter [Sphingomonas sp. GlSt437]|uniref:MFS transporter n=1 Tax=Sphingomonas sp. GlSt437 TaxID=3389970 RepID=UPI003A8B6375